MTCCGKIKQTKQTVKNIAQGYKNLAIGKKYEYTDTRIRACQKCEFNYWIGKMLFCSICKCPIPAKARAEENTCPEKKWKQ